MLTNEVFELSILDFELDNNHDLDDVADIVGPGNMGITALHTKTKGRSHASAEKLPMDIYMGKPFSELGMLEFIKKLRALRAKSKTTEKIRIRQNGETILIDFNDILFVRGNKNYTDFICNMKDGKLHTFTAKGSLGQLEEELSDSRFVRCHLSYIINKEKIVKLGTDENIYFDLNDKTAVAYYSLKYKGDLLKNGILKNE